MILVILVILVTLVILVILVILVTLVILVIYEIYERRSWWMRATSRAFSETTHCDRGGRERWR